MEKSDNARHGQTQQSSSLSSSSSSNSGTREQRYIRSGKMSFVQNPSIAFYGQDRIGGFNPTGMFYNDPSLVQMQNQFALNLGPQAQQPVYMHYKRKNDNFSGAPLASSPPLSSSFPPSTSFPLSSSFPPSTPSTSAQTYPDAGFPTPTVTSPVDDYDYDFSRPVKKFMGEERVIEIFDRLHIREGENYVVEDIDDLKDSLDSAIDVDPDHNVVIEELPEDCCSGVSLELCPELKNALASPSKCLTQKLIQSTRDSMNKALVVWQPPLLGQIAQQSNCKADCKTVCSGSASATVQDPESDDEDYDKCDKSPEEMNADLQIEEIDEFEELGNDDMDLDDEMDAVILSLKPDQFQMEM